MRTTAPKNRHGFTLLEATTAMGLTVFLALLLSSTWKNIGAFTTDTLGRGQLMQEIDMAVASLGRDLGGSAALVPGPITAGTTDQGRWIGCQCPDDVWHPGNQTVRLCYDGDADGVTDWDSVTDNCIQYLLEDDADSNVRTMVLVRKDERSGAEFKVARNLTGMTAAISGGYVTINLAFKYQKHSGATPFGPQYVRTLTLKAQAPQ